MSENNENNAKGEKPKSRKQIDAEERQARLAENLRANLRRRKDQSRERKSDS